MAHREPWYLPAVAKVLLFSFSRFSPSLSLQLSSWAALHTYDKRAAGRHFSICLVVLRRHHLHLKMGFNYPKLSLQMLRGQGLDARQKIKREKAGDGTGQFAQPGYPNCHHNKESFKHEFKEGNSSADVWGSFLPSTSKKLKAKLAAHK